MTRKLKNITRDLLEPIWARRDIPTERIAQHLGVTRAALSYHAHKLGLPSRAGNKEPCKRGSDEMFRRLWLEGVSSGEIAKFMGFSACGAVSRRAANLGLPPRGRGSRSGFRGSDGAWRKHTPIEDALQLQERLAEVMRRDAQRGVR